MEICIISSTKRNRININQTVIWLALWRSIREHEFSFLDLNKFGRVDRNWNDGAKNLQGNMSDGRSIMPTDRVTDLIEFVIRWFFDRRNRSGRHFDRQIAVVLLADLRLQCDGRQQLLGRLLRRTVRPFRRIRRLPCQNVSKLIYFCNSCCELNELITVCQMAAMIRTLAAMFLLNGRLGRRHRQRL